VAGAVATAAAGAAAAEVTHLHSMQAAAVEAAQGCCMPLGLQVHQAAACLGPTAAAAAVGALGQTMVSPEPRAAAGAVSTAVTAVSTAEMAAAAAASTAAGAASTAAAVVSPLGCHPVKPPCPQQCHTRQRSHQAAAAAGLALRCCRCPHSPAAEAASIVAEGLPAGGCWGRQ
jgi:hypothetical protein